jgi:membrane protein YdbS with pleckstrin-like domain
MGFPKRLLGEGETLVLELRPHEKQLVGPAALLLVLAPLVTFLVAVVPPGGPQAPVRWGIAAAALLVVLRWSVWPFLVWWNTVYVITDRRLVMRSGVLGRHGHDMPVSRLTNVTFSTGLVDRILGCGDLVVESAGIGGQVVLDDVPRVEQVQRTLYRLSDAARAEGPLGWSTADGGFGGEDDGADRGDGADTGDTGDGGRRSRWGRRR